MKNKRFLSLVMAIVLAASLFAGISVTASADGEVVTYSVKSGDYLYKICKNQGLDYYACKNAIMVLNGFTTETQMNRIYVGQNIKLPISNAVAATIKTTTTSTTTIGGTVISTSTTTTTGGDSVYCYLVPHTVLSGETLASICNALGTSYERWSSQILAMNGIKSVTHVWAGKNIYIPVTNKPTSGTYYTVLAHKVQSGDTMTAICNSYGMGYNAYYTLINGINAGSNMNSIKVGQTVYVPTSKSVGPTPVPGPTPSPVETGYNININYESVKGSPKATVGDKTVSKADAGKTVKIVANAKDGYALSSIRVVRTDGKADVVVKDQSFTMPPCDIDVEVKYDSALKITCAPSLHGVVDAMINGESVEYACYNDTITVNVVPAAKYAASSVSYTPEGGSTISITQKSDGTYSFKMPNKPITISGIFAEASPKAINTDSANGTVTYKVDGTTATEAVKNAQVVATVKPNTDYVINEVSLDGDKNLVTKNSDGTYSFKMKDAAVTFKVTYTYNKTYSITANQQTGGTIKFYTNDGSNYTAVTKAVAGTKIYVVPTPNSGKAFDSATATYAGSSFTPVEKNPSTDEYVSFVMPANNVTVKPVWNSTGATLYKITKATAKNGSFTIKAYNSATGYVEASSAAPGTNMRAYFYPAKNYKTAQIKLTAGSTTNTYDPSVFSKDENGSFLDFSMLSANTTVEVTFTKSTPAEQVKIGNSVGYLEDINGTALADGTYIRPTITAKVDGYVTDNTVVGSKMVAEYAAPTGFKLDKVYIMGNVHPMTELKASGDKYTYTIAETDAGDTLFFVVYFKAERSYAITCSTSGTGTYTVNGISGNTTAYSGQAVQIAASGTVEKLELFSGSGASKKNIEYVDVGSNTYIFYMPAADVAIDATVA